MNAILLFLLAFWAGGAAAESPKPMVRLPMVVMGLTAGVESLDPFSLTGIDSFTSTGLVIEPLAILDRQSGEMIPKLATGWTFHPKEKIVRVKLRPGVTFHNGEAFTSRDVKFTFDAYADPEFKGQIWRGMWEGVDAVEITGPLTLNLKLKEWRFGTFVGFMTGMRILPNSFYAASNKARFRDQIVGTGPFEFNRFESQRALTLVPNAGWWALQEGAAQPAFNLNIKRFASESLAGEMIGKGEADFFALAGAPSAGRTAHIKSFPAGLGTGIWLELNMKDDLFQSPRVRHALQLLWRRQDLNKKVFNGKMKVALDIFSPAVKGYPPGKPENDDLNRARALLKEDGWRDLDKDAVVEKNGKSFEFTILVTSAEQERWVTLYQTDAARAGVRVKIERREDDAEFYKRQQEGKYQVLAGDGGLMDGPTRFTWHSAGPYNFAKYANAEADRLIEALEAEFSAEKRRPIMRKLLEVIRADRPVVPGLYSLDEYFMTSDRLIVDPRQPASPARWKLR